MIEVTKINGDRYFINAETIDFIEELPDTTLTLASGKKVVVREAVVDIVAKVIEYKQKIYLGQPLRLSALLEDIHQEGKDKEE